MREMGRRHAEWKTEREAKVLAEPSFGVDAGAK